VRSNDIDLGVRLLPAEAGDPRAELRFELIFRDNIPMSRQAASFVQRRFQAVIEHDLEERLTKKGDHGPPRASWRFHPIADEKGHSFWLGTLIPLVLILMTVTGAVYPAIDLTAGERERGTLESLMAAPVPRLAVLIAKYIAVIAVATMTAIVNLTAMTATLTLFGKDLWSFFFGTQGSPAEAIVAVLLLLILFAAFFSAVLLLVTSFARSFKEAQAYVVPLMVASLAPGFMSVMPGLELGPLMSVVPLANIVLLARDVLEGDAPLIWAAVAVLSTILYGGLALALAARIFGSDAILYGSEGSWSDLFRQPRQPRPQATLAGALTALSLVMPLFIVASGMLSFLDAGAMTARLLAGAGISLVLFAVLPMLLACLQGVDLAPGFQLRRASFGVFIAAGILGFTLWPLAYDLIVLCQNLGIATLTAEKIKEHQAAFEEFIRRFRAVNPGTVLLTLAIVPAIGEELFFRGYVLGALRGRLPAWAAIGLVAIVFGLFHASFMGLIAIERVASSTLLGVALGWLCWTSRSVLPGMLLHTINNAVMLSLVYAADQWRSWGYDAESQRYLPWPVFAVSTAVAFLALLAVVWLTRRPAQASAPPSTLGAALPAGDTSPSPVGRGPG